MIGQGSERVRLFGEVGQWEIHQAVIELTRKWSLYTYPNPYGNLIAGQPVHAHAGSISSRFPCPACESSTPHNFSRSTWLANVACISRRRGPRPLQTVPTSMPTDSCKPRSPRVLVQHFRYAESVDVSALPSRTRPCTVSHWTDRQGETVAHAADTQGADSGSSVCAVSFGLSDVARCIMHGRSSWSQTRGAATNTSTWAAVRENQIN